MKGATKSKPTSIKVSPKGSTKAGFMKTPCHVYNISADQQCKTGIKLDKYATFDQPLFWLPAGRCLEHQIVCDALGKLLAHIDHTYQSFSTLLSGH